MSAPRREYLEIQLGTRILTWRRLLNPPRRTWWAALTAFLGELFG